MSGHVTAVVGGQFGSEGKGNIVCHIAHAYQVHVRTGGPNAGHSFIHNGKKWAMQSLPCGWVNPNATLFIGPGAVVEPHKLVEEIERIRQEEDSDILDRVKVSACATVITQDAHIAEGGTKGALHQRIGSTGEGVGVARIMRMQRDNRIYSLLGEVADDYGTNDWSLGDLIEENPVEWLNGQYDLGAHILLEGTQGSGLSLVHGPWPYVTSADTNAAQLAVDAGIAPSRVRGTILVFRTYPIRVAGNSGPLYNEVDWQYMSDQVGHPVEEHTTVTKKVRRIGTWDEELARRAMLLNRPTGLALNFMDYRCPQDEGVSRWEDLSEEARKIVLGTSARLGAPILYVGTGGPNWSIVDVPQSVYDHDRI